MSQITPNCRQCSKIEKVISNTTCGVIVYFECSKKGIRIYRNPEMVVCSDWEEE